MNYGIEMTKNGCYNEIEITKELEAVFMKKLATLILAALLIASLATAALAVPKDVEYDSTRSFLEVLDDRKIEYDYNGVDDDGDEGVYIAFPDEESGIAVRAFFDANGADCSLLAWNVIDYDEADFADIVELCNQLNADYRWVRFYADTSDDSVTVAADASFTKSSAGMISAEMMDHIVSVVGKAWPELSKFRK